MKLKGIGGRMEIGGQTTAESRAKFTVADHKRIDSELYWIKENVRKIEALLGGKPMEAFTWNDINEVAVLFNQIEGRAKDGFEDAYFIWNRMQKASGTGGQAELGGVIPTTREQWDEINEDVPKRVNETMRNQPNFQAVRRKIAEAVFHFTNKQPYEIRRNASAYPEGVEALAEMDYYVGAMVEGYFDEVVREFKRKREVGGQKPMPSEEWKIKARVDFRRDFNDHIEDYVQRVLAGSGTTLTGDFLEGMVHLAKQLDLIDPMDEPRLSEQINDLMLAQGAEKIKLEGEKLSALIGEVTS